MSEKEKNGGDSLEKGYQPRPDHSDYSSPEPLGGYQPPVSEGDNPGNEPSPPSEE